MSIDWIRSTYGVAAKRGGRVEYSGTEPPRMGTITGTQGSLVCIRLDGSKHSQPYHPTWKLRYLDQDDKAGKALGHPPYRPLEE